MALGDRVAVFDAGRLVQVGTPQEVYDRPVDRFVADFIGETTFLETAVVDAGGVPGVRLPGGDPVPLPGAGRVGDAVTLAVRPERVRLLPPGAPAPDGAAVTTGTVRELTYMGTDLRSVVALGDQAVAVRTPALLPTDHVRPGATVTIAVAVEHLRPVAQARTAVEDELAVEEAVS